MASIDGRGIAERLIAGLRARPKPAGSLAVVMIGNNVASRAFVARKRAVAERLSISFDLRELPSSTSQADAERILRDLSRDPSVSGIVLQLPLPLGFDRDALIACIDSKKDIDNLTGRAPFESPAVGTVRAILDDRGYAIRDFKSIVLMGQGFLTGKPITAWLARQGVSYSVVDIDTENPRAIISRADLVISGVGKTGVVDPALLADGAAFIDFGIPPDADQDTLVAEAGRLRFHTPTPGGTGPILVAILFGNFYVSRNAT